MTTVVSVAQGGTGSNNAADARSSLGAAPSAAYDAANNAYAAANTASSTGGGGYDQANAAYLQANNAYLAANNSNLKLGGVITGTLNVTQDIIVGGNVYLEGNTTYINVATYSIEDSLMYLASNNSLTDSVDIGFMGGKNTSGTYSHTGFARDATDGKYKLFDGLPEEGHVGNVINFANTYLATLVANVEANTLTVVNGVSGNVNFDSGTLFVDSVGNKVGIGTTTPTAKLDIVDSVNDTEVLRVRTSGGNSGSVKGITHLGLHFFSTGNNSPVRISVEELDNADYRGHLLFSTRSTEDDTAPTERMRIDANGNVGIGTTNPGSRLHILDSSGPVVRMVRTSNRFDIEADNNAMGFVSRDSATANAYFSGFTGLGIGTTSPSGLWSGDERVLHLSSSGGTAAGLRISSVNATAEFFSSAGTVEWGLYSTTASPFTIYTNNSHRFRITSDGNVGIGTTSPSYKLDVDGTARFRGGSLYLGFPDTASAHINSYELMTFNIDVDNDDSDTRYFAWFKNGADGGGTELMRLTESGNIGIGTTSPAGILHLEKGAGGNVELHMRELVSATSYGASIDAWNGSGGNLRIRLHDSGGTLQERFRITAAGNIGIGTNSPSYKLDVAGAINSSADIISQGNDARISLYRSAGINYFDWASSQSLYFSTQTSSGGAGRSTKMVLTDSGNVGIGTTSPSGKLHLYDSGNSLLYIEGGAGYEAGIWFRENGVNKWEIYKRANPDDLNFYSSDLNASVMTLAAAGGVGIGTLSPNSALHVIKDDNNNSIARFRNSNSTLRKTFIQFEDYSGIITDRFIGVDVTAGTGAGSLMFFGKSTSSYQMVIDNNGNVGIGNTAPASTLTVAGTIESTTGGVKFPDGTTQTTAASASADPIPSGTTMLFVQTSAPTGWTKSTTHNDKALRVVSGSVSTGGSVAFTSAFASQSVAGSISSTTQGGTVSTSVSGSVSGSVGSTTLSTSEMPSHGHSVTDNGVGVTVYDSSAVGGGPYGTVARAATQSAGAGLSINATGGSGSHNHSWSGSFSGSASSTFTGSSHGHTFTGTAINLAVQYVDVIIATKN